MRTVIMMELPLSAIWVLVYPAWRMAAAVVLYASTCVTTRPLAHCVITDLI
jgi:hypothetical protein